MIKNNVLDPSYSMLLSRSWLQDAKVTHGRENNFISIEGNGTICTIVIIKHLDSNTKCPKVLFCYDFVNEVKDEEKNMLLATELDLFTINTITLLELKILAAVAIDAKTDTNVKTNTNAKINIDTKTGTDMKIGTDELIFDFPHTP
jgi:hypothetical protein